MAELTDAQYVAAARALLGIKPEHAHLSDKFVLAQLPEVCDPGFFRAALAVAFEAGQREGQRDAVEYTVCAYPDPTSINYDSFAITVRDGHAWGWGVTRYSRCLNSSGEWVTQPDKESRDEEWAKTHRFDLDTALRLAREAAPHVRSNRETIAEVWAWEQAQGGDPR